MQDTVKQKELIYIKIKRQTRFSETHSESSESLCRRSLALQDILLTARSIYKLLKDEEKKISKLSSTELLYFPAASNNDLSTHHSSYDRASTWNRGEKTYRTTTRRPIKAASRSPVADRSFKRQKCETKTIEQLLALKQRVNRLVLANVAD